MKIAIGADHGGYVMKEAIKSFLKKRDLVIRDFGAFNADPVDYPDIGKRVARAVASGKYRFGLLFCGTGIGMSIVANKVKGIRAAVAHDIYTAKMSRAHNDANILAIGARVIKSALAVKMVAAFLDTPFEGGRHLRRVRKIGK